MNYVDSSKQLVSDMEGKMNEYEQAIQKLTSTVNQKDRENIQKDEQIQQLQNQLYLTQNEYEKQSAELAKTLQDQESIYQQQLQKSQAITQQQQNYDVQYLKLAYNTQLQELEQLKTDLKAEKEENKKLNLLTQSLQTTMMSKNDQTIYNIDDSQDLQKLIKKQQLLITALAAPFDISSQDVKQLLLEQNTNLNQQNINIINQTLNRGLYLLGMRQQDKQQSNNAPWKQDNFLGQSKQDSQQADSFLQYNQLLKLYQLSQEKNQVLQQENKSMIEQIRQLNVQLSNLHIEHEKQTNILAYQEKQHQKFINTWYKQINQLKNMQQILNTTTNKARNEYKKACYILEAKAQQNEEKLKSIQLQNEQQTNQIQLLTNAIKELKNVHFIDDIQQFSQLINIQPQIINMKDVCCQELQQKPPSEILTYLEHEFNKFYNEMRKNNKVNDNLVNIILNLLQKQKTKFFNIEQFKRLILDCGCQDKANIIDQKQLQQDKDYMLGYLKDQIDKQKADISILTQRIEQLSKDVKIDENSLQDPQNTLNIIIKNLSGSSQIRLSSSTASNTSAPLITNTTYLTFLELLTQKLINWEKTEFQKIGNFVELFSQQNKIQQQNIDEFQQLKSQIRILCSEEKLNKISSLLAKSKAIEGQIDKLNDITVQQQRQLIDMNKVFQALNEQVQVLETHSNELEEVNEEDIEKSFEQAVEHEMDKNDAIQGEITALQNLVICNRDVITSYIKQQRDFNTQKMSTVQNAFDNIEEDIKKTEAESAQVRRMYIQQSNKFQKRINCLEERVKQLDDQLLEKDQEKDKELRDLKEKLQQDRDKVINSLQQQIVSLQNVVKGMN